MNSLAARWKVFPGILIVLISAFSSIQVRAESSPTVQAHADSGHEWYFTPKAGFSPFTGIIGFEAQYRHFALDIGLPYAGGVRYYFRPAHHSWFAGIYGHGWSYDQNETKGGVDYTHYSNYGFGPAGGYRWLWKDRWSFEVGLGTGYYHSRWTNSNGAWRTEYGLELFPVGAVGYSFH